MIKPATFTRALAKLIASSLFGLASFSAHAAEEAYTFKSVLSTPSANWCINAPSL